MVKKIDWLLPMAMTITLINLFSVIKVSDGERYVTKLNRWYFLAGRGNWEAANRLEKKLDTADTQWFKDRNKTEDLKKRLNQLTVKMDKTSDDWMEMASIQSRLQKNDEAKISIEKAFQTDPIRKDVEKVYFSSL